MQSLGESTSRTQTNASPVEQAPRAEITVAHIQDLIDTNKALRESVMSIAALLKEQTRQLEQPRRQNSQDGAKGLDEWSRSRSGSRSGYTGRGELRLDVATRQRRYEENWKEIPLMSLEDIEEERMQRRRNYESHWPRPALDSFEEKAGLSFPSLLPHFDPWWNLALDTLRTTNPQSRPIQSASLRSMLHTDLRYDLFIALFGSEFCFEWTSTSRSQFEDSRRLRFRDFLSKVQSTGAIAYFGEGLARVLVEVAEWTNMVWTTEIESKSTLENLRSHCYERRVLAQPPPDQYELVEEQDEGLLAIIYALDFRRSIEAGTPWDRIVSQLNTDSTPLSKLLPHVDKLNGWTEKVTSRCYDVEPSKGTHIHREEFNVRTLRELGDIEIVWTNELEFHLRLTPDAKKLYVFEHPTWLFGRQFNKESDHGDNAGMTSEYNKIFHDLAQTYALLFGPITTREKKWYRRAQKADKLNSYFLGQRAWFPYIDPTDPHLKQIRLTPNQGPAREFLENFRTVKVSPGLARANDLDPINSRMADLLGNNTSCPDDIAVMMLAVIRHHDETESLTYSGLYFENQLRTLKAFMDGKKPRTIRQLWSDARDATSWWTFWTVLFFGVLSIALALGSLIVGIAQTVGTFQAIH